jgi:hypothetical protein
LSTTRPPSTPGRQPAEAVGQQQFDALLGLRVEGGVDARAAGGGS